MDMAYVRSRGGQEHHWIASVLHESQEGDWLKEYSSGWIIGKRPTGFWEVRYRQPYVTAFVTTDRDRGRSREDLKREMYRGVLGATLKIDVRPNIQVEAPFWIADRATRRAFNQGVVVKMTIASLAEYPDVRACIESVEAGVSRLLSTIKKGPLSAKLEDDVDVPGFRSVREIAEEMLLCEGLVMVCQTSTSGVVLTLGACAGNGVFHASAAVCGDAPLAKGDELYRSLVAHDGKRRHQVIGTVLDVL